MKKKLSFLDYLLSIRLYIYVIYVINLYVMSCSGANATALAEFYGFQPIKFENLQTRATILSPWQYLRLLDDLD